MSVDAPEDLYALALDQFVPARTALVKALRADQRREQASEVVALRKPSVAAWAVNQLVRTQPKALAALFAAGDDLARAQSQAAAGKGGGDAMRGAMHRQRDALGELVEAAERLLSSAGQPLSQSTIERIGETLRAAANDEDARQQVAGGCLTRELRFVGVGLGIGGLAPASVTGSTVKDETASEERESAAARTAEAERVAAREHAREHSREQAREQAAARKAARRTESEARRAATRAQKELAAAQARQVQAAASLQEAETLLSVATQRAQDAAAALTFAERAVAGLRSSS